MRPLRSPIVLRSPAPRDLCASVAGGPLIFKRGFGLVSSPFVRNLSIGAIAVRMPVVEDFSASGSGSLPPLGKGLLPVRALSDLRPCKREGLEIGVDDTDPRHFSRRNERARHGPPQRCTVQAFAGCRSCHRSKRKKSREHMLLPQACIHLRTDQSKTARARPTAQASARGYPRHASSLMAAALATAQVPLRALCSVGAPSRPNSDHAPGAFSSTKMMGPSRSSFCSRPRSWFYQVNLGRWYKIAGALAQSLIAVDTH